MRIAILISGHLRSFEQSQDNINLFRALFPVSDLFIHTWDSSEMNNNSHHIPYFEGKDVSEKLLESFRPKGKIIENQIEIDLDKRFNLIHNKIPSSMWPAIKGYYWMIYGITKCTELMINEEIISGEKYDYVIRYRFDLVCENRESILRDFDIMKLYDRSIILSTNKIWWPLGVFSDVFWIAQRFTHERIVSCLNQSIDNGVFIFKNSNLFLPELVLTNVIKKLNFKIISSSGFFHLRRSYENHLISRKNFGLLSSYRDLRFCWNLIVSRSSDTKFTFLSEKDILKDEWRENVVFPLNIQVIARVIFICVSLVQKFRKVFV